MIGRPKLSPEERQKRKELSKTKKIEHERFRKENGICRNCDNPISESSTVLCDCHLEENRKRAKTYRHERAKHYILKNRSREKGLPFDISVDSFNEWLHNQARECHYCGAKEEQLIHWKDIKKRKLTIDRKDNSRGYDLDNMCLACFRCNSLKGDFFTCEQWKSICQKFIKPRLDEYHGIHR